MKITAFNGRYTQNTGYDNPFKRNNIHPFSEIGRVVVDKNTGEIRYRLHEYSSLLKDSGERSVLKDDEDIMVYFPLFYCKRVGETDNIIPTYKMTDNIVDYEPHPVFVREDGSIRPYILVGAFPSCTINGQLRSTYENSTATWETDSLDGLRSKARYGRDDKWNLLTIDVVSMIQLLYKIAFQELNTHKSLFSNKASGGGFRRGKYASLRYGNVSGYINDNNSTDTLYTCSLFGLDDYISHYNYVIDGLYFKENKYYICHHPSKMATYEQYDMIPGIELTDGDGTITSIYTNLTGANKYLNLPKTLSTTNTDVGYCSPYQVWWSDFYLETYFLANNIHGQRGLFSLTMGYGPTDVRLSPEQTRVVFLP